MYKYEYKTLHDLLALAEKEKTTLSDIVVRHEVESSEEIEERVRAVMASRLDVFQESIDAGMKDPGKSVSGLVGGDAHKLAEKAPQLLGSLTHKAAVYALAVSEANAKMFKIVACPTAGSCGIVPAVMMAADEILKVPRKALVDALFTAAGIGAVVARNASVAGAVGGCQAECGTAAAMAAAAVAEMAGGDNDTILQAFALCMKIPWAWPATLSPASSKCPVSSATPSLPSKPLRLLKWLWPASGASSRRTKSSRPWLKSAASCRSP